MQLEETGNFQSKQKQSIEQKKRTENTMPPLTEIIFQDNETKEK